MENVRVVFTRNWETVFTQGTFYFRCSPELQEKEREERDREYFLLLFLGAIHMAFTLLVCQFFCVLPLRKSVMICFVFMSLLLNLLLNF